MPLANSANTDILISLHPSYLFSFVMGFAPFTIDRKNQFVEIKYSRIYNILSALIYSSFMNFLLYIHWYELAYDSLTTPMQKFIIFLYFLLVVGFLAVAVIFNKMYTKSILILWEEIYNVDGEIKMNGIKLNYRRLKWSSITACFLGINLHSAYFLFLAFTQEYKSTFESLGIYFSLNFYILNFMSNSCFFYTFYHTIGHMFERILENLENLAVTNPDVKMSLDFKYITETAILHQRLCYIARLTNKITSPQMLISFAVTFSLVTLQIYSIVTAIANNNHVMYAVGSFLSIFILLAEKSALVLTSHRCMKMIPKSQFLLSKILNLYSNDSKLTREVNAFSLQLLHEQFEITAGNFFVIDIPIFIAACGAITTYIILFVQADPHVDLYQTMKDSLGVI